jgi:hypothetical protein
VDGDVHGPPANLLIPAQGKQGIWPGIAPIRR